MPPSHLTLLTDNRLPIMVVSHERSGTHFFMNTMAACFDYVSDPWVDIDRHQFNINYYHPPTLQALILEVAGWKAANILKSHHEFAFFSEIIAAFEGAIRIVYVFRNPADVMASYWRFLHTWPWVEGPKTNTAFDFAMTAPMGRLLRLQFQQFDTMLDRWASHVRHWVTASEQSTNIHIVKYESLDLHFDDTVTALGAAIGLEPRRLARPSRYHSVVTAGEVNFDPAPGADNRDAIADLAMTRFPDLMTRLGYDRSLDHIESRKRQPILRQI